MTKFHKIARSKGWTFEEIASRWDGLSARQMSRIAKAAKQRDIDAVNGLPEKKRMKYMKEPPVALVKTWYLLLTNEDPEVQARGMLMLKSAFKDERAVQAYLKKYNII